MRNHSISRPVGRAGGDSSHQWYKGFDDEQFICFMNEGWYVESREGEFGPFDSLREAEDFYYVRFARMNAGSTNPNSDAQTGGQVDNQ